MAKENNNGVGAKLRKCRMNCGFSQQQVAKAIGVDDRKGSLDAGKDADIIITDSDFNIMKTIIGGEVKYEV